MTTESKQEKAKLRAKEYYTRNKEKYKARSAEWKRENLERIRNNRQAVRGTKEGIWDIDAWCGIINNIRARAKKRNLPFNLTAKYLASITPEYCPVLGIPLLRSVSGGATRNSPSVDRLDPDLGYVEGNVIVVSMLANSIRSSATPDQIEAVATFYRKILSQKTVDQLPPSDDNEYN